MLDGQTVLASMSVHAHPGVYLVARGARGVVTFQCQQQRALNLIWALNDAQSIAGKKLAIVGGGLAGMTAALSADRLGAVVSLFEEKPELMHLQRGSQQRYVHPNIYLWPNEESKQYTTKLPLLNWYASIADDIADTVWSQWEQLGGNIVVYREAKLTAIAAGSDGPVLTFSGKKFKQDRYDVAVLAVGFGLERAEEGVDFLSYWHNDNFGRPVIAGPIPRRFLISGCGDGGIIDAVRLCLEKLDQAALTKYLLRETPENVGKQLMAAEERAAQAEQEPWAQERISRLVPVGYTQKEILAEVRGQVLSEEYAKIDVRKLLPPINKALHKDREIILNGPAGSPYSLNASIFNRFALYLLLQSDALLTYIPGRLRVKKVEKASGLVTVRLKQKQSKPFFLDVHEVVVRHGSESVLGQLFSKEVLDELGKIDEQTARQLSQRQYPPDFLRTGRLDDLNRQVALRHAAKNVDAVLSQAGIGRTRDGEVSLVLQDGKVRYVIKKSGARSGPSSFEDVPITVEHGKLVSLGVTVESTVIRPGLEIGFWDQKVWRAHSRIACIVQLSTGPAILTVAGDQVKTGMLVSHPSAKQNFVGTVVDQRNPAKAYLANDTASRLISSNWFAGTIVHLNAGVQFDNSYRHGTESRILTDIVDPARDQLVRKVSATGETYGLVTATGSDFEVDFDGPCFFHDVFLIEPRSTIFATPADVGSLVVDEDGRAVGLLLGMAGVSAVAVPIQRLMGIFKCELWLADQL